MRVRVVLAGALLSMAATAGFAQETVRMGTEGYYPPFNYFDASGQVKGFDIDIGNALCAEMEVKCEWISTDWEGIIPALNSEKFDAILASMAITEERKQAVDFTNAYYYNAVRLVTTKDSGIASGMPADLAGKIIGTQASTEEAQILQTYFPQSEVRLYPKLDDALLDLESSRVDLVLASSLVLGEWLKKDTGDCCQFVGETFLPDGSEGTALAVRKNDQALRDSLNKALSAIQADGTYKEISARYFDFDIMSKPKEARELFK